uniref:TGF-beta family profile domain-containing protein n=1 Tax=Plectus sambesii TaxID=2011161 RepID=A0A914VD80_9BILA
SLRVNLKKERTVAPVLLQVTNADGSLVIGGEGKVRHHWVSIDANQLLRYWIDNRRSTVHQAQITCSNCDLGLDWLADDMPIFVQVNVATPGPSAESRRRRSSECGVGENKGCCLQSYYINFTTIGWDDWILEPPGYYVNYCVGVCNLGQASSVSAKLTEAQRAVEGGKSHSCCSPKAYGPLTLIYAPELFLYYKKTLKQMVVTDCGC